MKTYFDCIPCFIRQALDSARLITDDENVHEQVVRAAMKMAVDMDLHKSPPAMAKQIHRLIRQLTGIEDPYKEIKINFNTFAMQIYPEAKKYIEESDDKIESAVKLAIAGNIIDFGINAGLKNHHVQETIDKSIETSIEPKALQRFKDAVKKAKRILYIGDNAGEIVFDKLLIEQLPMQKITFAVRGKPIINDITMEDAEFVSMADLVPVIDNGDDAPGTILEDCSRQFQDKFAQAELIIAKGQGNYETLSEADKNIFFILKAKCEVIARHLGCEVGSMILKNKVLTKENN